MKRNVLTILISVIIATQLAFFASVQPAQAQFGGVVTDIGNTATNIASKVADAAKWTYEKSSKVLEAAWKKGGAIAYRNALNYFLGQMARDAAVRISGGCSGQEPCFQMNREYWSNLGDAAAGDFLDTLAQQSGFLDNGLCEPFDPAIKLQLNLAVGQGRDRPARTPRCSFSQIRDNIRELSLRDLFEVDLVVGRGSTIQQYSEELDTIIKRDTGLDDPVKERLLKTANKLTSATENLSKYVEKAKSPGQDGADENILGEALANIMDAGVMLNKNTTNNSFDYYILNPSFAGDIADMAAAVEDAPAGPPSSAINQYYFDLYERNKNKYCAGVSDEPPTDGSQWDGGCSGRASNDKIFYENSVLRSRDEDFPLPEELTSDADYKASFTMINEDKENNLFYFVDQVNAFKDIVVYDENLPGPPAPPYPAVRNPTRGFAVPDPDSDDPITLFDDKFPENAQFCTADDIEPINTDDLIQGGGADSFTLSDYNEDTVQQMLPGDAVASDVLEVASVLSSMLNAASKYNPAPMISGSPYQQAAANLNAQFEDLVIAQYSFIKVDNLGAFQDPPFDADKLSELNTSYNSVVPNVMTLVQDFETYYDALSNVEGTNGSEIEPKLNTLKSKIKNTKDSVKNLGSKVQRAYQKYDEERAALAIIADFAFDGEVDGSEHDEERAQAILPYLESVIQMYEALEIMNDDLKNYADIVDSDATGLVAGNADDYAFQSCRERTQEYLQRLDAWYNTLYKEAVKINDARRAHAFDRISASEDLADVGKMFNEESNPIGAFLSLDSAANQKAAEEIEKSKFFDSINGAFKGVASTVSGVIKTPAPLVEETGKQPVKSASEQFNTYTGEAVADAVGIFTNTLMSQMLKKWFEGPGVNPSIAERVVDGRGIPVTQGIKVAKKLFSKLGALKAKTVEDADVLTLLSTSFANQPPIINSRFKTAIEQQLTVREALSEEYRLLDPNAWFGYQSSNFEASVDTGIPYRSMVLLRHYRVIPVGWELAAQYINENGTPQTLGKLVEKFDDPGEWSSPYSISNMSFDDSVDSYRFTIPADTAATENEEVKIFVPGSQIEIYPQDNLDLRCHAEINSYSNGTVVTKEGVICLNIDQARVSPIAILAGKARVLIRDNPYYGLVNPDWVLKAPQLKCNAEGPGEIVIRRQEVPNVDDPSGPKIVQIERANSCADEQTCVYEKDGQCEFGYCTKEKFIWEFEGNQECRAEYNSCASFTDSKGSDHYYLKNTLNTDGCSRENVGCREYLRVSEPVGAVQTPSLENELPISGSSPLLRHSSFSTIQGDRDEFWCSIPGGARCRIPRGGSSCEIEDAFGLPVETCSVAGTNATAVARLNARAVEAAAGCDSNSASCQKYLRVKPLNRNNRWVLPSIDEIQQLIENNKQNSSYENNSDTDDTLFSFDRSKVNPNNHFLTIQEKFLNSRREICSGAAVIGCQAFIPTGDNSTVTVHAKLKEEDQCFKGCVGFNDYIEAPTQFDPGFKTTSFIPANAESCSAAAAGCEEFTNVNALDLGLAEAKEYYTDIRWCANDSQVTQTADNFKRRYFVWEGADIFGFQLRAIDLLRSNEPFLAGQPCTNPDLGANNTTVCNDTVANTLATTCSAIEAASNPDCREYIDTEGDSHFVFQSKTIPVSSECRLIRRTVDSEMYNVLASSSNSCSASENLCRRYEGPQAGNVRVIFSNSFNDDDITRASWSGVLDSDPASDIKFLRVDSSGALLSNENFANSIDPGREYYLSFVYKVATPKIGSNSDIEIPYDSKGSAYPADLITDGEWHSIQVGPIQYEGSPERFALYFANNEDPAATLEIDSIKLTTQVDVFYRRKNTIQDQTDMCGGFQGCSEYRTKITGLDQEATVYNYKFSEPCEEKDVGCEAVINTNNTAAIGGEEIVDETGKVLATIPQDYVEIVRVVEEAECASSQMGCSLVSLPIVSSENTFTGFEPVYIKDDPTKYNEYMCGAESVMCEAYKAGATDVYFKDPQGRLCEFIGNEWQYEKEDGTLASCPTVSSGSIAGDREYKRPSSGYIGMCTQEFAGCTELQEVSENKTIFVVGPIDQPSACTSTDIKFKSCRYFDTHDVSTNGNSTTSRNLYRVRNNRVCGEWLECRSGTTVATVDENGNDTQRTVCLDRYACQNTASGVKCEPKRDDEIKFELTYDQPTVVDFVERYRSGGSEIGAAKKAIREFNEFNQLSGLSKAGLVFNDADRTRIGGNYHPVQMRVDGESANVVNFNFERDLNGDNLPDGWIVQEKCHGACNLEKQEVKSGAHSLKIGSVTSSTNASLVRNRYSTTPTPTVNVSENYQFTATVRPVGSIVESQNITFRFSDGPVFPGSGSVISSRTLTFEPGDSEERIIHNVSSPTNELDIDILTTGDFTVRDIQLLPDGSNKYDFEGSTLGEFPATSRWLKSFGCTNCSVAYGGQSGSRAIQIAKQNAVENICMLEDSQTLLADGTSSSLNNFAGDVCVRNSQCYSDGFDGRGPIGGMSCEQDEARIAYLVGTDSGSRSYSVQGYAYSPSASSSSTVILPEFGVTAFSSGNNLDNEWFWEPYEPNPKNGASTTHTFVEPTSHGGQFNATIAANSGQTTDVYFVFDVEDDKTVLLDDLVFYPGTGALPDVSTWSEIEECSGGTCGTATARYIRLRGFEGAVPAANLIGGGLSMKVLNIRPNTDYVLSGWVNTKGLEKESIGNEIIHVTQFEIPTPDDEGVRGLVGVPTLVRINNSDDKWKFFTSGIISTDTAARSLRIDLLQNIQGFILYDDIQLRPVLRIAPPDLRRDAGPTCRMYPAADAAQCDAVNAQGEWIKGWKGYCMERDPANPSVCIQWYPVDVIKDETNTFAKPENVGYQGGGPVYHCAVAKEKKPNIPGLENLTYPRILCAQTRGSPFEDNTGCYVLAVASDPKPGFYEMTNADWRLGIAMDQRNNRGDTFSISYRDPIGDDKSSEFRICSHGSNKFEDCVKGSKGCFEIAGHKSNDGRKIVFETLPGNAINAAPCSKDNTDFGSATPECFSGPIDEVYHKVKYFRWSDQEGCKSGEVDDADGYLPWSELNETCAPPYCNSEAGTVLGVGNFAAFARLGKTVDSKRALNNFFGAGAEVQQRIPRPLYCSQIVKTVDHDGENAAWNSRLQGAYTGESPIRFGSDTQCIPFSATPPIDSPHDILQLVDTNNDFIPDLTQRTPLLLYSPGDTQNNDKTQLCKEVHRGNMAFAYNATIKLCEGGTQEGNICFTDIDCAGGGSCTGADPQDDKFEDAGISRVLNVFARIFKIFDWDETAQKYEDRTSTYDPVTLDKRTDPGPEGFEAPVIDTVRFQGKTTVSPQNADAVDVAIDKNARSLLLEFTTNIPQNHLPIRSIEIDWGDEKFTRQTSLFIDQRRNLNNAHKYTHVYDDVGEYTVRIRVTDNWGWCNKRDSALANEISTNYAGRCTSSISTGTTGNDYLVNILNQ